MTEQHILELKESGIVFDKVLHLSDGVGLSEDLPGEPGSIIQKRMRESGVDFAIESEIEYADNVIRLVKEHMGEELVREISIRGSEQEVFKRVQNAIDPFCVKPDEESNVRVTADLPETGFGHLQFGEYADFCPVSFKENWMLQGKEEFELQV